MHLSVYIRNGTLSDLGSEPGRPIVADLRDFLTFRERLWSDAIGAKVTGVVGAQPDASSIVKSEDARTFDSASDRF